MGLITKALSLRGVMCGLHEDEAGMDPIALFDRWYRFAKRAGVFLPNAVCLATVSPDGKPSARMMLLKGASEKGFIFYTNYESPRAARSRTTRTWRCAFTGPNSSGRCASRAR